MFKDLIEYKELFEACAEYFQFGDVTFIRDFGPWKKGDHVDCISFQIDEKAVAEIYDDEGKKLMQSCKFQLVALPE